MISDKLLNEFAAERIVFGCSSCQKLHGERRQLAHEIISLRNQMIQAARGSADIVDLAEENVKLLAQNVAMKEALSFGISLVDMICTANKQEGEEPTDPNEFRFYEKAQKALSPDVGKDYHNPADVEALKLAREALKRCMISAFSHERNMAGEALAAIDKVFGGKEDDI
ncbi:MAG TPA: hypothetical protein VMV86_00940 [Methanosarcinales archaeon]|nr:hypothetical protein [Methanosarcinales archaeon]